MNDWTPENVSKLLEKYPDCCITMETEQGISLRDYFAGQALAGFLSCPGVTTQDGIERAYDVADKLLAERDK